MFQSILIFLETQKHFNPQICSRRFVFWTSIWHTAMCLTQMWPVCSWFLLLGFQWKNGQSLSFLQFPLLTSQDYELSPFIDLAFPEHLGKKISSSSLRRIIRERIKKKWGSSSSHYPSHMWLSITVLKNTECILWQHLRYIKYMYIFLIIYLSGLKKYINTRRREVQYKDPFLLKTTA